ncbi:hypothetical protein ACQ4LE_006860 [Meloidogyne hapla]
MFNNLQVESKLDIFKCLNIKQLITVQDLQTNLSVNKIINIEDGVFKLKITSQLMEKWQSAVDRKIPVYLNTTSKRQKIIKIYKGSHDNSPFILNLPIIPEKLKKLKIIRCWMEKISLCYFNDFMFHENIFNPELIQLIFEKEEIDKIKFNGQSFYYFKIADETTLLFYLNRLFISDSISLSYNFNDDAFKQQSIDILFKFLLKIPSLYLSIKTFCTLQYDFKLH